MSASGLNPTGRERRSSAGKRRQADKRARSPREGAGEELALARADYASNGEGREAMDQRDRFIGALLGGAA